MEILWFYVWFSKACTFHLWKKYRTCSSFKDNPHTLLSTRLKSGTECLWQLERGLNECLEVMHLCCIYTCIIMPLAAIRSSNTDLMACLNSEQHAGWKDELPERTHLPVNILLSLWFAHCSCVQPCSTSHSSSISPPLPSQPHCLSACGYVIILA